MGKTRKVKFIIGIIVGAFLLILSFGILLNLPEDKTVFSFSGDMGLWQASVGTMIKPETDSVKITKGQGDFYVVIPQINIPADRYDVCILEMELPIAYDQGSFIFLTTDNIKKEKVTLDFDTGSANRFNRLHINVSKHDDWHGIIRGIVFFPATNSENVLLRSMTFVHANLSTKLRAWWNDFTRYLDPPLGAVFGWPSPFFIIDWFNPLMMPFFWILLCITLLIIIIVSALRLDIRFSKITIDIFFSILLLAWALLDLGNNVYYMKAIKRNASLYWGRDMVEKRGIVTGNPDFIRFLKFCDDNIPMDAHIFNYVARDYSGSAEDALAATQFNFNLRPRVESLRLRATGEIPKPYYILYRYQQREIKGTELEQNVMNHQFVLQRNDRLLQEVRLQHYLEDISQIILKINSDEIDFKNVAVTILADDRQSIIGSGKILGAKNGEVLLQIIPQAPYRKCVIFLEITNNGQKPVSVGGSWSDTYREGRCFVRGEEMKGDLALRIDFNVKNLMLFKKFNEYAYILTK